MEGPEASERPSAMGQSHGGACMKNTTLESAIELAIVNEQEDYDAYMELCGMVDDKDAKDTLKFLA
jgi:rubrerythrin